MPYRYGKKPALHTARTMRSALALARHLDPLGPPPAASNPYYQVVESAVGGPDKWEMEGNDVAGDCVFADTAHDLMLRSANVGQIIVPTTAQTFAAYSALTGYDPSKTDASGYNPTDQGTNELDACRYNQHTGFLGHKSVNYGSIDPRNADHLRWGVQLFGGVRLGIRVPEDMEQQFEAGRLFTRRPGSRLSEDGHDIRIVHYVGDTFLVVTWGRRVAATWPWLLWCMDEAHIELYPDWVRAQGTAPNNLSLDQLTADLASVEG